MDDTFARQEDSAPMTRPVVTEIAQAMQAVDRDTFLEPVDRPTADDSWPLPRRRPADA
jgi:hypothetical protein